MKPSLEPEWQELVDEHDEKNREMWNIKSKVLWFFVLVLVVFGALTLAGRFIPII